MCTTTSGLLISLKTATKSRASFTLLHFVLLWSYPLPSPFLSGYCHSVSRSPSVFMLYAFPNLNIYIFIHPSIHSVCVCGGWVCVWGGGVCESYGIYMWRLKDNFPELILSVYHVQASNSGGQAWTSAFTHQEISRSTCMLSASQRGRLSFSVSHIRIL